MKPQHLARAVLVSLVLLLPLSAAAEPEDIRAYCQRVSRGSYQSESWCVEAEQQAYQALASRQTEQRILDYCNRVSRSWQSLKWCIEAEEQAKAKMGR